VNIDFLTLLITGPTEADWKLGSIKMKFPTNPRDEREQDVSAQDSLRVLKEHVGGYIEMVPVTPGIHAVCNEEGKLQSLPPTAAWLQGGKVIDILCGNLAFIRHDQYGNTLPLHPDDIHAIKKVIRPLK
jgi:hypothetical protein